MKKSLYIAAIAAISFCATSCDDYLEKEVDLSLNEEQVFSKYDNTNGFLANIYSYLPDAFKGFGVNDGGQFQAASHDCMTDNATSYWNVHYYNSVQADNYDAKNHFYAREYWVNNTKAIRAANQFMANAKAEIVGNQEKEGDDNHLYYRWMAEARLLRAIFHFDLIGYFGDIPIVGDDENGQPIVFKKTDTEKMNQPRVPAAEALQWVADECDAIIKSGNLPFRYQNENANWGRVTTAVAYALKSRALLYKASPLNNPSGNTAWWQAAAQAARDFDRANQASANPYSLYQKEGNPNSDYYNCFVDVPHLNNEYILSRSEWNTRNLEQFLTPCGFTGSLNSVGRTNPTLNLVSAYETANGLPYDLDKSYDPQHPYDNRDPRLDQSIFHQNTVWGTASSGEERAIDVASAGNGFAAGLDYKELHGGTLTGFYCKKFCMNISFKKPQDNKRACPIFRYAEIMLNAAEAINEAEGPTEEAYRYVQMVRGRVGMPDWRKAYGRDLTKDEFRERIQNERRIELAFEDHRFCDERRWELFKGVTVNNETNKPLYHQVMNLYAHTVYKTKISYVKNENGTLVPATAADIETGAFEYYDCSYEITNAAGVGKSRVFSSPKNYYFPIPYTEIQALPKLGQNRGWEL